VIQLRKACSHPYLFPGIEPEPYEEGEHLVQVITILMFLQDNFRLILPELLCHTVTVRVHFCIILYFKLLVSIASPIEEDKKGNESAEKRKLKKWTTQMLHEPEYNCYTSKY